MTKSIYEKTNFAMVQVVFVTDYHISHDLVGQRVLAVVGAGTALGSWDPNDAPRGIEYPPRSGKWYITTWLPADEHFELKLAVVSPGPGYVLWETGGNKHIPPRTRDGTIELAWGNDQVRQKTIKLPREMAFCTIMTRHWLPDEMHLKMVGSFQTIGDWNILKASKTRVVPGTTDWQYTCTALPKRADIEWKWGVCRPDGTNAVMERWTNRFMLLNTPNVTNYLIFAPWEVYALVMEIRVPTSFSDYDNYAAGSYDNSPSSSGPGSSLPSPDSFPDFQNYKGNPPGGGSNGNGILRNNGWYNGGRQCNLTPQTIELLRKLIVADEVEERKEREEEQQGDRSPRRASRVSPLPPIEELSPEREEELQHETSPEPEVVEIAEEEIPSDDAQYEIEEEKEDGESCYGSMASVDTRDSERLVLEVIPTCEHEGTETSPSSDEMNLECRNTLYGNEKVARSCQEVSHWLLNYTHEPMKKSYSLDVGVLPQPDQTMVDVCTKMEVCDELELDETSAEVSSLMSSRTTQYTTFPSGWSNTDEDQFIQIEEGSEVRYRGVLGRLRQAMRWAGRMIRPFQRCDKRPPSPELL